MLSLKLRREQENLMFANLTQKGGNIRVIQWSKWLN